MGGKQDQDKEAYGKPAKYDPSFRGPIRNRSCTDIICCVLFFLFILGYIAVGILAWVYGDPKQVLYPRNSTGAYCGIGENKEKPYLLYFNIFSCVLNANIIAIAQNGLKCPTPQVCVSSCPEASWTVEPGQFSQTVEQVFYAANRNFCLPGVPGNMQVLQSLQQELCPSFLLPSTPALGRCFPWTNSTVPELPGISNTSISQSISGLLDSLNARDISVKIFEDFAQSWYWILIALGVALVLSLLFILLLRLVAGPLVFVLIIGVLGVLAYGIYHCWEEYRVLRDKGASISQLGFTTDLSAYRNVQETWLAALIILAVLEGVLLLMLIFLRQRICIAIALLKEASRAVGYIMSTMFYPLVTFALLLVCIAYWAIIALFLATSGQPQYMFWAPNSSLPGCEKVPMNTSCDPMEQVNSSCPGLMCVFQGYQSTGLAQRSLFNLQIYAVLGLFWTINWVLALGQCVLAGAFASFYWAFHKPRDIPTFPLGSAFLRTLRYHTGSLAFGALILTLVQIARVILEYIDHKLRGAQNPLTRCILCCFKCCLWCLEKFIKFLNRNAYIMIAIYGKNFCVSAKNAFMLLMRNIVRVVVLDKVTDLLLFFGKLLVVGGVGVLSFFFFTGRIPSLGKNFENPQLNYYWLPIMVSILGAYLIASGFFSVFGMCVDTLFLCFLEDLERNDGSADRPYYMSKSLLKILGKKNKGTPGDKKRKK
ncbi:choline transporter-like protein 4 [Bubalus kerabau]|uniref:choline transporter-like protein 4 n=1 Tax=Bubalus bubalis TaxID=89462 RepID=UPI001E1B9B2B|nr:choline transporter-like protein 4 [Bubalus bubalis]XP_055430604.1 choline transporter-like protein 4 [Bubalus carabanensis]